MWKLNDEETTNVRTAATQVNDAMNAILKECGNTVRSTYYLKEKILKAVGWLRILNDTVETAMKEEESK